MYLDTGVATLWILAGGKNVSQDNEKAFQVRRNGEFQPMEMSFGCDALSPLLKQSPFPFCSGATRFARFHCFEASADRLCNAIPLATQSRPANRDLRTADGRLIG